MLPNLNPIAGRAGMRRGELYSVYGLTLASDYPLARRLPSAAAEPDLTFTCEPSPPLAVAWDRITPTYVDPQKLSDGTSILYTYQADGCKVVRFTRIADFYIWRRKIVCHLHIPLYHNWVEIWLLGIVLAYWLEHQGTPALHASSVVVDGKAVAFLSSNKGGKSSLAASMLQAGYPLLTDDILPVERLGGHYLGRPGYPQMRMWPDQAEHFVGSYEELEQVHPEISKRRVPVVAIAAGSFCAAARPLGCLYLPERRDTNEIDITPLSPMEAVMALVRNAFLAHNVGDAALEEARFKFFAELAGHVPVKALRYPSGLEHLPTVRDAVLADLAEHTDAPATSSYARSAT